MPLNGHQHKGGRMGQMDPMMLTPGETGQLLRIGRNKTYELIAAGTLPTVRFGRAIRIPRAALEAWVEEQSKPRRKPDEAGDVDMSPQNPVEAAAARRRKGSR